MAWYGNIKLRPAVSLVQSEDRAHEVLAAKMRAPFGAEVTLAKPGMTRSRDRQGYPPAGLAPRACFAVGRSPG